jgi:hypothetical protein
MSLDAETLYRLLPAVYRIRDAAQDEPLRALVGAFARELQVLEENLEQLYDDQFIETCADWAAPYIGELIGYRSLHGASPAVASPRAEVANTIAYRRRKGTALMLEELARNVTDWPARAVEFFEQLATTQYMNHPRLHAPATAAVRSQRAMLPANGPFNRLAHTVEVRSPDAGGRYNIPNIGIYLWRLQPYRLRGLPLVADPGDASGRRHRVNPLGADLRLFRNPQAETEIESLAAPKNVPDPLRIREFALQVRTATATLEEVKTSDDYGAGRSVVLSRGGNDLVLRNATPTPPADPDEPLVVRIADLRDVFDGGGNFTGWAHEDDIGPKQLGLDPERGRILLGTDLAVDHAADPFKATFHYGFSRDIGGGEYERNPTEAAAGGLELTASGPQLLQPLLDQLETSGGRLLIEDSLTYKESPIFKAPADGDPDRPGAVVGTSNGQHPLIAASAPMTLQIAANGTLVLDGLVISGAALHLPAAADNEKRTLVLRDCTLVPGLTLGVHGEPGTPGAPSLIVEHPFSEIILERCITGALQVIGESNVTVNLKDCIVDATTENGIAFAADAAGHAGAEITLEDCTVIGRVNTRLMRLASNCIFTAPVTAARRQEGCMRFSFVPEGSITPRRFRCQPDAAHPQVLPHFTSLRYGEPGYCQLRSATPRVIREGASDGGEMGVMHPLLQPQRETNLRIRLDEYLRFGLRAGLIYAT